MSGKTSASVFLASASLAFTVFCAKAVYADSTATYSFNWYAGDAVANFPAPMTLREGLNGFTYAGFASDGSDLRVKDSQGNLLPHEIEKWDPDGYSIVWVKLPSLSQSATVALSWGDPDAATATGSLWDDAIQVLHFGDDIKKDSSKWALSSTQTPDAKTGIVGGGMTSAANSSKRFLVNSVTPSAMGLNSSTPFTIAFWMKGSANSENNYAYHLRKKGGGAPESIVTYNYNEPRWGNVWPHTVELIGGGDMTRANSHIEAPDFDWHHFAYTYDGSSVRKYLDGALVGTVASTKTLTVWQDGNNSIEQQISVGGPTGGGAANESGATFDELRLEPVCRSAAWIKALALTPAQVHDNDAVYVMSFPEYTGTETLTNFPLMVTLDDRLPGLPDGVKTAMRDVRRLYFYTADGGTELQYEMELTPTEGGTAATYWVLMPEFGPGTTIRVQTTPSPWPVNKSTVTQRYWASDAGAVNTNVWAGGQFLHVYHLAVGRYRFDSAPFGGNLDGSWGNWRATSPGVDGPTGRFGAMHCTTNTGMRATMSTSGTGMTRSYSVSFWARKDAVDFLDPQPSYILQVRSTETHGSQWGVLTGFHGDGNRFKLWKDGVLDGPRIDIPDADWHHYAYSCDGSSIRCYRDGEETGTAAAIAMMDFGTGHTVTVGGAAGAPNPECFRGDIDEFRLEGGPRSADWFKACYQTQFARRRRVTRLATPAFGPDVRATSAALGTLTFAADLACRVPTALTLHYGPADCGAGASGWAGSQALGTVADGRVSATISGLSPDQGVHARFHASNAYGEAWSAPICGRAPVDVRSLVCYRVVVTNLADGVALRDFPLCVRIAAALEPPATPATLRFTDNAGLPLAHEVEKWDASGESIVWVRVPEVRRGTRVRMLWGEPFLADEAPASSVWSGDFEAVYHMASPNDSSSAAMHFTSDKAATNGVVGAGRKMGASGGLVTPEHLVEGVSGPFTISGWLCGYANMGETYVLLKCIGGDTKQLGVLFGYVPMTLQLYMPNAANPEKGTVASEIRNTHSLVQLPDDGWHHFAYTYDGMTFGAYLDGAPVRELKYNLTQCGDQPSLQVGTLRVGRAPGGGNLFKGGLDELRLETAGRSAEWIKACYDDQRGALTEVRLRPAGAVIRIR